MKKITIAGILAMIALSGCSSSPGPNMYNKDIKFVDGKPYSIPGNTIYTSTKERMKHAEKNKICKRGQVFWMSPGGVPDPKNTIEDKRFTQAKSKNYAGCVSPLNKQEYQYRMVEKQQEYRAEQASKARAQESFDKTMDRNQRHNEAMLNSMRPQVVLPNVYSY